MLIVLKIHYLISFKLGLFRCFTSLLYGFVGIELSSTHLSISGLNEHYGARIHRLTCWRHDTPWYQTQCQKTESTLFVHVVVLLELSQGGCATLVPAREQIIQSKQQVAQQMQFATSTPILEKMFKKTSLRFSQIFESMFKKRDDIVRL